MLKMGPITYEHVDVHRDVIYNMHHVVCN